MTHPLPDYRDVDWTLTRCANYKLCHNITPKCVLDNNKGECYVCCVSFTPYFEITCYPQPCYYCKRWSDIYCKKLYKGRRICYGCHYLIYLN